MLPIIVLIPVTEEELRQHIDTINQLLNSLKLSTETARQQLLGLLNDPTRLLSADDEKLLSALRWGLTHDDNRVQTITRREICLALLKTNPSCKVFVEHFCSAEDKLGFDSDLFALDEVHWQLVCKVIALSDFSKIDLHGVDLRKANIAYLRAFFEAIAASQITSVELGANSYLHPLDLPRLQIVCDFFASPKLRSIWLGPVFFQYLNLSQVELVSNTVARSNLQCLYLTENNLCQLDVNFWRTLLNGIASSLVTTLGLRKNNLRHMDSDRAKILFDQVMPKLTAIDLGNNELHLLDKELCCALFNAIANSPITSLGLASNNLHQLDEDCWKILLKIIELRLTTLDIASNDLHLLTEERWQALCDAIAKSNLKSINFDHNQLGQLDATRLQALSDAIARAPQLQSISLAYNQLDRLNEGSWQIFWDAIATSSTLTTINWDRNEGHDHQRHYRDKRRFQILCDAIVRSKLTFFTMNISSFDRECKQILFNFIIKSKLTAIDLSCLWLGEEELPIYTDAIKANFSLEDIHNSRFNSYTHALREEIAGVLLRNKKLHQDIVIAKQLLEKLTTLRDDEAIIVTVKTLFQISANIAMFTGIDTPSANDCRRELQRLSNEFNWQKACWLRDNYKKIQSETINVNTAISAFHELERSNPHYAQAHFEAFQLAYSEACNEVDLKNVNAATRVVGIRNSFITALPCCLDDKDQLMSQASRQDSSKFTADQQRVFDGYLFDAVGGEGINFKNRIFSSQDRKALLQYVLLMAMLKPAVPSTSTAVITSGFFADDATNVKIQLKEITAESCLEPNTQKKLQKLWDNSTVRMLRGAPTEMRSDEHISKLCAAVIELTSRLSSPEPAVPIQVLKRNR